MDAQTQQEAEVAVAQLRQIISLYEGADLAEDSPAVKQLDAARRAVAAYDAAQAVLADHSA